MTNTEPALPELTQIASDLADEYVADESMSPFELAKKAVEKGIAIGRASTPNAAQEAVEVVACVIGDYGPVDAKRMATVLYDDRKIAECYTDEDAQIVAAALRASVAPVTPSDEEEGR